MSAIPTAIAARIAARANREGWAEVLGRPVTARDVADAWRDGTHEHESFASFVLQEAEDYGVRT
jgi:hypothetical protein